MSDDEEWTLEDEIQQRDAIDLATLVPRIKVAAFFRVSNSTLWRWERKGSLTPIRRGGRVYYSLKGKKII